MKVYVCLNALPWEEFKMTIPDPSDASKTLQVQAKSSAVSAGFLPLFWSQETAEATFPGHTIQIAEVSDDWHPMLNQMKAQQEEIAIDTAVELTNDVEMAADSSQEEVIEVAQ